VLRGVYAASTICWYCYITFPNRRHTCHLLRDYTSYSPSFFFSSPNKSFSTIPRQIGW
jgi:hypothetical protein